MPTHLLSVVSSVGSHGLSSVDKGTLSYGVIFARERILGLLARCRMYTRLVLLGINVFQNLDNDVLYSRTISDARRVAMYDRLVIAAFLFVLTCLRNEKSHAPSAARELQSASEFIHAALTVVAHTKPIGAVPNIPPHTP